MSAFDLSSDAFLADCQRLGWQPRSIAEYRKSFRRFGNRAEGLELEQIGPELLRSFLAEAPHTESHLSSLFGWLLGQGRISADPTAALTRRRRKRAEDLEVVSISSEEVQRLLDAARGWSERLALGILAYLGPRRHAVALLRLEDWDELRGLIRFREKGGKIIWKPCPAELQELLSQAKRAGVWDGPAAYLVPPEGSLRRPERDDRVIYRIVKRVAAREGIEAHVHALRAAFACFYEDQNPGDLLGLRDLLGHASSQTTELYLRRRDKARGMERVRDLSWRRAS